MATGQPASSSIVRAISFRQGFQILLSRLASLGAILGPLIGLLIWLLPLDLDPSAHKAWSIIAFMMIYWMTAPIEYGLTALSGCFLFWAMDVSSFDVAFSGFTSSVPWFVLGALLIGQATDRTGLAKRLGYIIMQKVGGSYSRLLFGLILLALLLQFLVPSPNAQIAILASVAIGIVDEFELEPQSNVEKGLFLALTYASYLFSKMFLAGGPAILTRGIIEEQTGVQILWSQWAVAFLPLTLLTLVACWMIISWLYPPEISELNGGDQYLKDAVQALGPWSQGERKTLGWLVLATALWGTDFWHHLHPALIGIGVALILTLPTIGVLDITAVKSVNFLLVIFLGGAISLGNVLVETHALASVTTILADWLNPWLVSPLSSAVSLYWVGFLYHFPIPNPNAMVGTALPILLDIASTHHYNPIAVGLLWLFTSVGTLFIYQASSFVLGYSYGYFSASDLLKVGSALTVVEGLAIMVLVPFYWPLVGLSWNLDPAERGVVAQRAEATTSAVVATRPPEQAPLDHDMTPHKAGGPLHGDGPDAETTVWASIRDSSHSQDFIAFLDAFPKTRFTFAARMRLRQIRRESQRGLPPGERQPIVSDGKSP